MKKCSSEEVGLALCKMFNLDPHKVAGITVDVAIGKQPTLIVDFAPTHPMGEHTAEFDIVEKYDGL